MARPGGIGMGRWRDGQWRNMIRQRWRQVTTTMATARQDTTTMATDDDDDGDGATGDEVFNGRTNE